MKNIKREKEALLRRVPEKDKAPKVRRSRRLQVSKHLRSVNPVELLTTPMAKSSHPIHQFLDRKVRSLDGPYHLRLPGIVFPVTSSAGGAVALAEPFDPDGMLVKWTTWDDLFIEFQVEKIDVETMAIEDTDGVTAYFIDEINPTSVPVLADTGVKDCVFLSNQSNADGSRNGTLTRRLSWVPSDFDDTDWYSTSAPTMPEAALKIFSDTANFGTGNSQKLAICRFIYFIQFRGLKS